MSRPLRIAIAFGIALVVSIGAELLLVDHERVDETIHGDGLIGVWALLGIASVVLLAYAAWLAGRYVLQREDDPYSDGDGDG